MKKTFLHALFICFCSTTLVACASNTNNSKQSTEQKQTASKIEKSTSDSTVENTNETKRAIRTSFDSIKVGDLMNSGQGGTSKDDAIKLFGNPASTTNTNINGKNIEQVTWIGNGSASGISISIQFIDGFATNKSIAGYNFARKATKGLTDFNNIQDSSNYSQLIEIFGEPDTYSESLTNGQKMIVAGWTSGLKGSIGANFNAQFTNDVLTTKSQSGLTD